LEPYVAVTLKKIIQTLVMASVETSPFEISVYICRVCNKSFTKKGHLSNHSKKSHPYHRVESPNPVRLVEIKASEKLVLEKNGLKFAF
jgi:uncharacterized Zn-finger protein